MKKLFFLLFLVGLDEAFGEPNFGLLSNSKDKSPRFFKAQMITTFTDYVFSTKTIFPQCVSSVAATVCSGRRRRKRQTNDELLDINPDTVEGNQMKVDGSLIDSTNNDNSSSSKKREGRLGFTIWTTTRTTSTATVKYTNSSTTLSLLYACTVGNVEFPSQFSCITG